MKVRAYQGCGGNLAGVRVGSQQAAQGKAPDATDECEFGRDEGDKGSGAQHPTPEAQLLDDRGIGDAIGIKPGPRAVGNRGSRHPGDEAERKRELEEEHCAQEERNPDQNFHGLILA